MASQITTRTAEIEPKETTSGSVSASSREVIRFDHASVVFNTRQGATVTAIDNFDLRIGEGEFVALVGPSGCGKSTALRLVAGLIEPSFGEIRISTDPNRAGFSRIAMVFQAAVLLPWKTVLDNVLYPVRYGTRERGTDYEKRARELLEMVGLERFVDAYPSELSGGMQQRVAICRALILDASILLMDEPFSALDALTREEMQFELRRIHQMTGKTIIFVTHSISESVMLADRIVVMSAHPGRLRDSFPVDLPKERNAATLNHPSFGAYSQRVRDGIYGNR